MGRKTSLWPVKRLLNNTSVDKTWMWLRKRNFKRETESDLMAAQNNAIRINHINARIDKTQQNSKCRIYGDRDERLNHLISGCSRLARKEYKTRYVWLGRVIHWEMCKKFKFDHTNKWYMHNTAPVLENDRHKLIWDSDIHTDTPNLTQKTRPSNNQQQKKENFQNC